MNSKKVILSIGSNLGDRQKYLDDSIKLISKIKNTNFIKNTNYLETIAVDVVDQPNFLNALVLIETALTPIELLNETQKIEKELGRIFRIEKGPREIDIDILVFGELKLDTDILQIPHHSIETRFFIKILLEELMKIKPCSA